jgi:hypothetical protein
VALFPVPAHRTGRADLPHPALGESSRFAHGRLPHHKYDKRAKRDSSPRTSLSQSEHYWAFAKRALARGEDPEDVIRQIARYRGSEKSNPETYARLTVTKAQAELQRGAAFSQSSEGSPSHTSDPSHEP